MSNRSGVAAERELEARVEDSKKVATRLEAQRMAGEREEREEREDLVEILAKRFSPIPGVWLLPVLERACAGGDDHLRKEAIEAMTRRFANARREELRLASRPEDGAVIGSYGTRRKGQAARGYVTELYSVRPLSGSCSCRDFARSSLGLCKHLLAVLVYVASKPRLRKKAEEAGTWDRGTPLLQWDPWRPLSGGEDALERMSLVPGARAREGQGLLAFFGKRDGKPSPKVLTKPAKRLELVKRLLQAARRERGKLVMDAALLPLLQEERSRLERQQAMQASRKARRFTQPGVQLYPYQKKGVRRFLETGRLLLADDMGLGKTAQAIAACHTLWEQGLVERGLILVPAPLKQQWKREWECFSDTPVQIVEGGRSTRRELYEETQEGFLIANYEQVLRDLDTIQAWAPEILVLDEAQRIKNWATKTALSVKRIDAPYRLALTGTPLENRLSDLASIFDLVDDHALEPKWRLMPWHGVQVEDDEGRMRTVGVRNLDGLRARIAPFMERRLRSEVLEELPERSDTQLHVPMTDVQSEEHDSLRQPIHSLLTRASRRPLSRPEFLKLMQLLTAQRVLANGIGQADFKEVWPEVRELSPTERRIKSLHSPKLAELRELLQSLCVDQGRKVVVFSAFRRMLDLASWSLGDFLRQEGIQGVFFTGRESNKQRQKSIDAFLEDPDTRIFFASDAGSVGLNLQKSANACIHLDIPWNPAVLEQRNGRIYRLGQERKVDFYYLISEESIESHMAKVLSSKKALFDGLFDGVSDEVLFEEATGFLGQVQELYEEEEPDAFTPQVDEDAFEVDADEADDAGDSHRDSSDSLQDLTDESQDVALSPKPVRIGKLLGGLHIEKRKDGSMQIDADPEAAEGLATLFDSLAAALRS